MRKEAKLKMTQLPPPIVYLYLKFSSTAVTMTDKCEAFDGITMH